MEQQNQDPTKPEPFSERSPYTRPALIPAGKGSDGKPTFYIVVNQHGLDRLTENGLITEQRDRINAEFDLIDEAGKGLDNVIRSKRENRKIKGWRLPEKENSEGTEATKKTSQEALEELANIARTAENAVDNTLERQRDLARPDMFIIEVKKDGDVSKATRIFAGQFNEQTPGLTFIGVPNGEMLPDRIAVHSTLNLESQGLPKQSLQDATFLLGEKAANPNTPVSADATSPEPKEPRVYVSPLREPSIKNATQFREQMDKISDTLAQTEALSPSMRDALAKAGEQKAKFQYEPATSENKSPQAASSGVTKAKGVAA